NSYAIIVLLYILGKSVVQTPSELLKKKDEFAEIKCSHNIQSYYITQWYKQSQSIMELQLMGNINVKQKTIEPEFNGKIKLDGDGRNNVTLTIDTLILNDSAMYFCAAYYTVLRSRSV
uniref:Immunoglobulin V-set domain-containing protein n=1 Tax=Cyprinus carpio TaxID=7962 RepID=A0A8C1PB41_CYPCA